VSCVKTAEPIEMQFGMLNGVGPGNHILDGCVLVNTIEPSSLAAMRRYVRLLLPFIILTMYCT